MKIAFTVNESKESTLFDKRFGRAGAIAIYDTENKKIEFHNNLQNQNAAQGAGIQAAQNIIDLGVSALVTGNCGPKAFKVLSQSNIIIYNCNSNSLIEAIEEYSTGKLSNSIQTNSNI
ncbi:MAG: dinitrogenase iron-molybdenum cofactor biosynthesis protein [Candidatus Delongbacteria bacterium]|nr:dinitrogenase iron-molybdenum cofactor biosynthesis protein [Candidatus Delongbacteria bacterium]MBN2835107.1 dinitrogenase iron-molybdenum cofactor biosynthesis protein [Candidatus Delongbacteria bacterium]